MEKDRVRIPGLPYRLLARRENETMKNGERRLIGWIILIYLVISSAQLYQGINAVDGTERQNYTGCLQAPYKCLPFCTERYVKHEECGITWKRIEYVFPAYRAGCWLGERVKK